MRIQTRFHNKWRWKWGMSVHKWIFNIIHIQLANNLNPRSFEIWINFCNFAIAIYFIKKVKDEQ